MKHQTNPAFFTVLLLTVLKTFSLHAQSTCSPQGNVVVFSNYDGGILNININEDIPNLKIGIATYEPTQVNIFGPFAANVVEVVYAGNNPLVGTGNLHCDAAIAVGSIGPLANPNATVSFLSFPPVTVFATVEDTIFPGVTNLVGYNGGIICCTSCSLTQSTGGVNNADQIIDYFSINFGDPVRFLKTQYGCWCDTLDMGLPPSCCFELDDPVNGLILSASDLVVCTGQPVTLSVQGGSFSTYQWSSGQTMATIEVTTPGVYSVTATNECGVLSASITLTACPVEICGNGLDDDGDGLADFLDADCPCLQTLPPIVVNGSVCSLPVLLATPPQSGVFYQWFFNGLPIIGADQAGEVVDSGGVYLVTVVDAAGNCALSPPLTLMLPVPPNFEVTQTNIDCFREQNGALEVVFTGNTSGFILQWANEQGAVVSNLVLAEGLVAGNYTLTINDPQGCSYTSSYNIAAPAELLLTVTAQDASCLGNGLGSLTFAASGGEAPYTYSTDGLFFTQESVFNLPPGAYQPAVEDASGCVTSVGDVVVGEGTPLQIVLTGPTDSVPVGEPFNLFVMANKLPSQVTLQWSPEALVSCITCPEVVAAITETTTFVVQATDVEGCTATAQLVVLADNSKFVFAPNVFAPETFGLNAVFNIFTGQGVERLEVLRIYDRWGGLVFEGIEGWDGSVGNETAMPGVYAWYAELVYADGTHGKLEGNVTLIR